MLMVDKNKCLNNAFGRRINDKTLVILKMKLFNFSDSM